ncbi:hypothetical protein BCV70DRAFT_201045 [Testicularia cyperi]|uniref:Mis18 domain-containing protein n=1 Tax=Testicularia cyperi TaxID=1882483 RepID=A0A317XNN7_9BASI|nr:hypothetical protein BCV70DRAFT_201045 [Testicularia cyperi]
MCTTSSRGKNDCTAVDSGATWGLQERCSFSLTIGALRSMPPGKRPRTSKDSTDPSALDPHYFDSVPGSSLLAASSHLHPHHHQSRSSNTLPAPATTAAEMYAHNSLQPNGAAGYDSAAYSPNFSNHSAQVPYTSNTEDINPPPPARATRGRGRPRRVRGVTRTESASTRRGGASSSAVPASARRVEATPSPDHPPPSRGGHLDIDVDFDGNPGKRQRKSKQKEEEDDEDLTLNPLVFQCRGCFRLLGDSLSFISTDYDLGYVVLSTVSEVVSQQTTYETSLEPGKDLGSTFARLDCAGCGAILGRNYRTTPRELDGLRDCFSLEVERIHTYQLGSNCTQQLESVQHHKHPDPSLLKPGDSQGSNLTTTTSATTATGSLGARKRPTVSLDPENEGTDKRHVPSQTDLQTLEAKVERTRAFTIELSDRLIKAEADIRATEHQIRDLRHNPNTSTLNTHTAPS